LDENTIRVLREQGDMKLPPVTAMILSETDGYTEEEASFQMEKVIEVFRKNAATDISLAKSAAEAEELWRARKSAGSAAAQMRANNVSEDVTVPMSKVPDLLARLSAVVRKHGLPFVIFGHAGDGNLHPRIMYDGTDPDQVQRVQTAVREMFELTCELGGTLTGEHGIGLAKAPFMGLEHEAVALDLMRSLKRLLDPHNILNPGKMNLEN
jgi:glycolate oxidase